MKFECPVCQAPGDIPDHEDIAGRPAIPATCLNCGAELSVEHGTGRIKRRTAGPDPQKDRRVSGHLPEHAESSVLSMGPQDKGKKDYLAAGVFAVILCILIGTGVYASLKIKGDVLNQPLQMLSKLVDEVTEYGKSIFGEFQKDQQPRRAKRHVRKGYNHYKDNRLKEALQEFSLAIETQPQNAEAYFWRARTFIRMERYDNAMADLKMVVNLKPSYSPAYDNLGWLFMRRNDYDQSLANLDKSIELKPDNGWAHYMRGRVYFNKGDFQKAVVDAETACKLGYEDGCRDAKRYGAELTENG